MLLGALGFFIILSLGLLVQLDRRSSDLRAERAAHRASSRRCRDLEEQMRHQPAPPYRAPQLAATRRGYLVEQWATGRWAARKLDGFTYIGGHGSAVDALRALIEIEEAAKRPS